MTSKDYINQSFASDHILKAFLTLHPTYATKAILISLIQYGVDVESILKCPWEYGLGNLSLRTIETQYARINAALKRVNLDVC